MSKRDGISQDSKSNKKIAQTSPRGIRMRPSSLRWSRDSMESLPNESPMKYLNECELTTQHLDKVEISCHEWDEDKNKCLRSDLAPWPFHTTPGFPFPSFPFHFLRLSLLNLSSICAFLLCLQPPPLTPLSLLPLLVGQLK